MKVFVGTLFFCLFVAAGTVRTDFSITAEGAVAPEGWTYFGIDSADKTARFNALSDWMASPTFSDPITNLAVTCKCSSTNATRFLQIVPLTVGAYGTLTNLENAVTFSAVSDLKSVRQIDFSSELAANALLIRMIGSGSTGNWNVYSAVISHTGPEPLEAVANLWAEQMTDSSFVAAWDSDPGAESYGLRVWREEIGEPTGSAVLFSEEFSSGINAGGNTVSIEDGSRGFDVLGWSGSNVYLPARSQGLVQIGTGKDPGWLLSPPLDANHENSATVVIRAKRYAYADEGTRMPIDLVRGNETNTVGVFTLTDLWRDHAVTLGPLQAGDRLLVHSITNGSGKRAWIESVKILTDYVPGVVATNEIFAVEGLTATRQTVENLDAGAYWFAVCSEAKGKDGIWSRPAEIVLSSSIIVPDPEEEGPSSGAPRVAVTRMTAHSLGIAWTPVDGATGYQVEAVTNVLVAAREGATLWKEDFPALSRSERAALIQFPVLNRLTDYENWDGTNIYSCASGDHAVQLGNTSVRGTLATGPLGLEGAGRVLKFTAWSLDGRNMPFEIVADSGTNWMTNVVLSKVATTYWLPLPNLAPEESLVFHSTTNAQSGRVCLGALSVLADYVSAMTTAVTFVDQRVTDTSLALENLATTVVSLRVGAIFAGGTNWSDMLSVDLADPSAMGVWRVSGFENGKMSETFDAVTNISKGMPWVNGLSVVGFHAFKGGEEVASISKDSGSSTKGGLYASYTNDSVQAHSLSLLGTSGGDMALELRILNDAPTKKSLCGADISFEAYQWTFPEGCSGKHLEVMWAVTETAAIHPEESDWTLAEDAVFVAAAEADEGRTYRRERRQFATGEITVPANGMLWIRWRVAKASKSPMLGVGDVRVQVEFRKLPTTIYLR